MSDLEQYAKHYLSQYTNESFETVLVAVRRRRVLRWLEAHEARRVLEVGCGLEPLFGHHGDFDAWWIVEPVPEFARRAREIAGGDHRVRVLEGFLEDQLRRITEELDFIVISGVVHSVPEPGTLLDAVRVLCSDRTIAHFSVPNVLSFHRLLALEMGLIADVNEPSEMDQAYGHHRRFDRREFVQMLEAAGFRVIESGTYFVKPFTHAQMDVILKTEVFPPSLIEGLDRMTRYMPEHGCELYANARNA